MSKSVIKQRLYHTYIIIYTYKVLNVNMHTSIHEKYKNVCHISSEERQPCLVAKRTLSQLNWTKSKERKWNQVLQTNIICLMHDTLLCQRCNWHVAMTNMQWWENQTKILQNVSKIHLSIQIYINTRVPYMHTKPHMYDNSTL